MATCKSPGRARGLRCLISVIAVMMSACETAPPRVVTKTETEIAVAAVKDEWLKECEGLVGVPSNSIENLLVDYTDLSSVAAICFARQRDFVQYMAPIVKKAREEKVEKK